MNNSAQNVPETVHVEPELCPMNQKRKDALWALRETAMASRPTSASGTAYGRVTTTGGGVSCAKSAVAFGHAGERQSQTRWKDGPASSQTRVASEWNGRTFSNGVVDFNLKSTK